MPAICSQHDNLTRRGLPGVYLETALKLAQEGHNRATLLLEHQSKSPDGISQQLKTLEQRLVASEEKNQQQVMLIQKRARAVIQKYKQQLEQEKKKSFWEKIIGG